MLLVEKLRLKPYLLAPKVLILGGKRRIRYEFVIKLSVNP